MDQDFYRVEALKWFLAIPGVHVTSFNMTLFPTMGDRVAIALLKVLYPIKDPTRVNLKKVLLALKLAFDDASKIEYQYDKTPAVSLCLLELLLPTALAPDERKSIMELMHYLSSLPLPDQ